MALPSHYNGQVRPQAGTIYQPTSLDFINRPNPVEPQSVPQRHPLNGTPQLTKRSGSGHGLGRLLIGNTADGEAERPAKRRKSRDGNSFDLPKLPVQTKRLRIPPTLSGLHQPPPNAGLLPSISTKQPVAPPERVTENEVAAADVVPASVADAETEKVRGSSDDARLKATGKPKRNKWSDKETACLLKGVSQFGIGNWTKILNCSDFKFERRTALDLKDRFRVCRPEEYQRSKQAGSHGAKATAHVNGRGSTARVGRKSGKSDRKTDSELQELGINQPFEKTRRRKRHAYSAVEDEALLKGYRKHGNSWAVIREDENLDLGHRTATDLRDRMRTKFPDEYAKAGLAPRPEVFPKPPQRGKENSAHPEEGREQCRETNAVQKQSDPPPAHSTKHTMEPRPAITQKLVPSTILPDDGVFFGAPFEDEEWHAEPITLDRGILEWAGDGNKPGSLSQSRSELELRAPLRVREPVAVPATYPSTFGTGFGALPSVAAITALGDPATTDQLELPSLIMGHFETDGRPGGHFLGFDELLS